MGLSVQQIIPQKGSFTDDTFGFKVVPHLLATAGYRFLANDEINVIPSIMFKYVSPLDPQFDFNVKFQYPGFVLGGGSYRFKDGYAAMLGLNAGNVFNVGYAYDYTTTQLRTVSRELMK